MLSRQVVATTKYRFQIYEVSILCSNQTVEVRVIQPEEVLDLYALMKVLAGDIKIRQVVLKDV